MRAASTPTPREVERALKRLTTEQFAQVCSEIGILEVTLPGSTQAARAAELVARTQGHPDFAVLVRTVGRIEPRAWRTAPRAGSISSLIYGVIAFVAILTIGGLVLVLILSGPEPAAQVSPTATPTFAPSRTPVPTFTLTPSPTLEPTHTPTPTLTSKPTRQPTPLVTSPASPTATPSVTPLVSIVYPKVELQRPASNYRAYPSETVEFRWLLRGTTIAPDERFLMLLYSVDGAIVDTYVTADPWRFYVVPPNAEGTFTWTVTVVKINSANDVIGPISPESDAWAVRWQP